jgi:hypothetical protein
MTTEQIIKQLSDRVRDLETARNLSFVEELKRNALAGVPQIGVVLAAASITQAVRNAADSGSVNVAKVPDGKLPLTMPDGTIKYLGTYNS